MDNLRRSTAAAAALLLGLLVPTGTPTTAGAEGTPKRFDEIEAVFLTHPAGGPVLEPSAMNDRGMVAFREEPAGDTSVWHDGDVTRINPDGVVASVGAISNRGQLVGSAVSADAEDPLREVRPYSWLNGEWTTLPIGEAAAGSAFQVNDRGQVVGARAFYDSEGTRHREAVAWDDGEIVTPPPEADLIPGGLLDPSGGINDRGQVAVDMRVDGHQRAALWEIGGEVTELGTLGGDTSEVEAINNRGQVLGTSTTADGNLHAFLWDRGEMIDLGTPDGYPYSLGVDLNEWGQVVGYGATPDGQIRVFLWDRGEMTPITDGVYTTRTYLNDWGQVVGQNYSPEEGLGVYLWQNGRIADIGELVPPSPDNPEADRELSPVALNNRGQILGSSREEHPDGSGSLERGLLWTVSPLWGYLGSR